MKILHVISAPAAGGAEIYVKDLAIEMTLTGTTVFIAFLGHASDVGRDPVFEEHFLSELRRHSIEYFFIGHETRKNPLLGANRVRKFVKNKGVNIYHSHLKYGMLFGMFLDIPRIYTHHNIIIGAGRWWAFVSNRLTDAYIGISVKCSKEMESFFKKRIHTIFNGVNEKRLDNYIFERKFDSKQINLISVGAIHPQKNYKLLIDAVALLPDNQKKNYIFTIVGEGAYDYTSDIKEHINIKGVAESFRLLGNRTDVPRLLATSHVFIMSSAWEGLPISLLEATISGLPCIVTDVGGCGEIIEHCQNGVIVPPNSAQCLANAILSLLLDRDTYQQKTANALKNGTDFSIEVAAHNHFHLYRSLSENTEK